MGLSVAVAIVGIVDRALLLPYKPEIPDSIEQSVKPLHTLLYNKWYVDEIYDFLFVNGLCKGGGRRSALSTATWWMAASTARAGSPASAPDVSIWWDTWIVDGAVRFTRFFVKLLSYPACLLQTGRVQTYAFFVVVGVLAFLRVLHRAVTIWTSTYSALCS